MYASSRIHALERHMIGRERVDALAECRTTAEIVAKLAEYGLALPETEGGAAAATAGAWESMLLSALQTAYGEVEQAVPDAAPFRAFRYPYDCNNLKVAIKCAIRGIPTDGLFFDFGTVPADKVECAVREGKDLLSLYPPAMAAAVGEARRAYAETSDPRRIDAVLDRACYADMLTALATLGDEVVTGWMRAKIDLVNILMCLRTLRMGRGAIGADFLSETLLAGGTLPEKFFLSAYADGESALWSSLTPTPYAKLERLGDAPALSAVEKAADDLWMDAVRTGSRMPFGAPVVAGYLIGWETAVKNMRILLAAKDAGLSQEHLRERMRTSYV